ncbi:putative fatty acyl-CoA reductase CG8306 [Diorhabda carinulata]|uniref:putative fatty acyl-CoA reductase CG8306 n=1 Tax=Diorhabda carinulata TaxID=1163345 RepID=UPI0025A17D87|nr:putative fatty acyl-CoA reductase CG8306 [Diorhabda carinulata]XP_057659740.1 putative fatty acyl-CoA reductase CG8306 [Diorhabda carinulata]XP_057659741.1 putative fatty acyl-CoA reductase CG8306 [Diorhabda carinulata]XP_057659742.1 putative fatty acyl-CoA reductase CG8306 [Diorhabda carinulata]
MNVVEFFEGKTIFVTGATGFIGKVLIEKLLRSCPGIKQIYVLLRPKKGSGIEERLNKLKESTIFDLIRKNNPEVLNKVIGIKGDVSELNLGLSDSDRQLLVDNVNIIYHSAASVRFDDFLEDSIILNVRGTREISQLALDLKNPTIFVHISTAYSNTHQYELEERLYPPYGDWRDAILLAETCDKELLHIMTEKYIYPHVNTYTFAKGLGEQVVNDMCKGKMQTIITRPSIVVNTLEEPIPGWNDNLNGPLALMTASGKGILRVALTKREYTLNYVPVDIVIKGIILATYNNTKKNNKNEVEVYNITQCTFNTTQGKFFSMAQGISLRKPLPNLLWYPDLKLTACFYNYYIQFILFHILPGFSLDLLLRLIGRKAMVVRILRKIFMVMYVLKHFVLKNYSFKNDKMIEMQKKLKEEERDFWYPHELTENEIFSYITKSITGLSLYVLNESVDPTGRKELNRLVKFWYADISLKIFFSVLLICLLIVKTNFLGISRNILDYYFENTSTTVSM